MERTAYLLTAVVSMAVTGILGFWLIPWLKRLKYGQTINEIGPTWHIGKQGTPTIGGLMFIIGTAIGLAVGYISLVLDAPIILTSQYATENVRLFAGYGAALAFGLIGFVDDYLKVIHTRNLGLTAKGKIFMQIFAAAGYLYVMHRFGGATTVFKIPFIGDVDFGIWYYAISMLAIIYFVNSVNLTDGIDGLASSVTFVVSCGFIAVSSLLGYIGTGLLATSIAAGCVGFVIWNFYPAKVFMGDTGSMFLGGAVMAMGYGVSFPVVLLFAGIVYICEALSVVIQVTYFKLTHGKRIFKMSPIHHHFEMCGWSEIKIVTVFSTVALIGVLLSVAAVIFTP